MTGAIVLCGGSGTRMGPIGVNKTLLPWRGEPLFIHSVRVFSSLKMDVIVAAPADDLEAFKDALRAAGLKAKVVPGGGDRYLSVLNGLRACVEKTDIVLIHDGARPRVSPELAERVEKAALEKGGAIPALPCVDTIKTVEGDLITGTPTRSGLKRVQTPQGFRYDLIRQAYERFKDESGRFTDDASVLEAAGKDVYVVEGDPGNEKITVPQDYLGLKDPVTPEISVGIGQDTHRLVEGRKLILCGVEVPFEKGLLGHSDADVAVHALIDAILGAAALGDIGRHFPDSDEKYRGISSLKLLEHVMNLIREKGFALCHADITVTCQRPKLKDHIEEMRKNLAVTMGVSVERVSVKATTSEGLGYEGRGEGISAMSAATLMKN